MQFAFQNWSAMLSFLLQVALWLGVLIVASRRYRRHPRPSLLAIVGASVLLGNMLLHGLTLAILSRNASPTGIMQWIQLISAVTTMVGFAGQLLIVAAVFVGRGQPPAQSLDVLEPTEEHRVRGADLDVNPYSP